MRGEFVDLGGARLYCYAFGSRGAGDPIVLVHGCFTSSRLWQELLPRLPAGHRLLVVDLLGHGRSDPADGRPMTIAAHADRLAALLDLMGIASATVVGHGMGATIAAVVAQRRPERVPRLALVNPASLASDPTDRRLPPRLGRLAALAPLWRRLSPSWLASALHAALLPGFARRDAGSARALDVYLRPFRSSPGRESACAQLRALASPDAESADAITAACATGALPAATTLVLGDGDPFLPADRARRLTATITAAARGLAVTVSLAGIAHMVPEEAPDRLATAIAELLTR